MNREMTCILCPQGCKMMVEAMPDGTHNVTGNACVRGERYAHDELTAPLRTLTTTVALIDGHLLPVRSAKPLPKERLLDCMRLLNTLTLEHTPEIGGVVLADILGLGVDIIATAQLT